MRRWRQYSGHIIVVLLITAVFTQEVDHPFKGVTAPIFIGILIGLGVVSVEALFVHKLERLPYIAAIIIRIASYLLISLTSLFIVVFTIIYFLPYSPTDLVEAERPSLSIGQSPILYIAIIVLFWQLSSFFTRGVLWDYLLGRYHKPSIDNKIFLFIDLNDSTAIAEQLGPQKMSLLLRDFIKDIDRAVQHSSGKIFQYVGDEIAMVFPGNHEGAADSFNTFRNAIGFLKARASHYQEQYGVIPSFKGGAHAGSVSISQIGVSKRDIGYHGDTVNTASRLMGCAKNLSASLVVSKELMALLNEADHSLFIAQGKIPLKGKAAEHEVFTFNA